MIATKILPKRNQKNNGIIKTERSETVVDPVGTQTSPDDSPLGLYNFLKTESMRMTLRV